MWGLRRDPGSLPPSMEPLAADLTNPETLTAIPPNLHTVFYTASPDQSDESGYRAAYIEGLGNLLEALKAQEQRPRVIYTSSTAVYAQQDGEWVDETSVTTPEYFSGRCLLEGEQCLQSSGFPSTIVRLSGIYGPGRTRMIQTVQEGSAMYQDGQPRYTNHIHRDDCVGGLAHLMAMDQPDSIYLGVDHEPADRKELLNWLAKRLNAPAPQVAGSLLSSSASRQARNNKRCKNAKLINSGYMFRYPTFREGYTSLLAANSA